MLSELPELVLAPMLVGCATLVDRRWGARVGGVVSALPAVVAPVLLIAAQTRGAAFAADAADGVLLGLAAFSGFVLAYGRVAGYAGWRVTLAAGWSTAVLLAVLVGWWAGGVGFPGSVIVAAVSLGLAYVAMPGSVRRAPRVVEPRGEIPLRMAVTAALVALLAAAAHAFGALVGGLLAGLPVLASVLAVFTHRRHGSAATVALLRGMLVGMSGFVGFCAVVALLIVPAGPAVAFAAAAVTAVGLQILVVRERRWPGLRDVAGQRRDRLRQSAPGAGQPLARRASGL